MKSEEEIKKKIQQLEQQIQDAFKLQHQSRKKDLPLFATAFLVVTRNSLNIKTLKWVLDEKISIP
jgi:hypothetical protein